MVRCCYAMDAGIPRVDAQGQPSKPEFAVRTKSSLGMAPHPLWQLVHLTGTGNNGLARLPQAYIDNPREYLLERTADARRLGLPVVISRPYGDEPGGYRTGYRVGEQDDEKEPLKRLDLTWPHSSQSMLGSKALASQLSVAKALELVGKIDQAILCMAEIMPEVIVYVGPPPLDAMESTSNATNVWHIAELRRPAVRRALAMDWIAHDLLCSTPADRRSPLYCYDNTAMSDPSRPTLGNLVLGELFGVEPLTHGVEGNMRHTDENVRRWNSMPFGFMAMTLDRLRTAEREQGRRPDALLTPPGIRHFFRAWTLTLVIGDSASPSAEDRVTAARDVIGRHMDGSGKTCAACAVGGISSEQWTALADFARAGG